jgi:Raf kinase inhibitor-like YbhB/YbcL family protein
VECGLRFWPKKKWKQALLVAFIAFIIVVPIAFVVIGYVNREPAFKNGAPIAALSVSSPAFENGAAIPTKYTALGENINPPLTVQGIPEGTESLAVVVLDPVVPGVFSWAHWIVWNLPPTGDIAENTDAGVQGINSWNQQGYSGPDPVGERSYVFTVYALDETLTLDANAGASALLRAMDNHVLAKGQLIGTYQK